MSILFFLILILAESIESGLGKANVNKQSFSLPRASMLFLVGDTPIDLPTDDARIKVFCTSDGKPVDLFTESSFGKEKYGMVCDQVRKVCVAGIAADSSRILSNYTCGRNSKTTFSLKSIACNINQTSVCTKCKPPTPWCRWIRNTTSGNKMAECFAEWNEAECIATNYIWCPSNALSLCESLSNKSKDLARYTFIKTCPKEHKTSRIVYNGESVPYAERLVIRNKSAVLTVELSDTLHTKKWTKAFYQVYRATCYHPILLPAIPLTKKITNVELGWLFANGTQEVRFLVTATYPSYVGLIKVDMQLDAALLILDATANFTFLDNKKDPTLIKTRCKPYNQSTKRGRHWRDHSNEPGLKYDIWWTIGDETRKIKNRTITITNATFDIIADVFCHINTSYQACNPFGEWWEYGRHSLVDAMRKEGMDLLEPPTVDPNQDSHFIRYFEQYRLAYIISFTVAGVLLVISIGVGGYFFYKKRKRIRRNKALRATYGVATDVLDFAAVRALACEVIGSREQSEKVVQSIIDEAAENAANELQTMPASIHPEIKLRKATRLKLTNKEDGGSLNVTKMDDYHKNTLLLGQTPTRDQFGEQWEAIWQEHVGIVVRVVETNNRGHRFHLEDYISLKDGDQTQCGKFVAVTAAALKVVGEYDQYAIELSKGTKKRKVKREITFIYVDASVTPSKMVDLVELVQEGQGKKYNERLPAVLFECATGAERSATLLTVFVGRQMWMDRKKINLIALLKYVRRNRYGAFSVGDGARELQLVFGMMQIIATRTEMGNVGALTVEAHERDVFDQNVRRKELEDAMASVRSIQKT